ncbi:MAG TPA: GDSL-type esterase/lipase family protein [Bacteroidota bacterium]|jgi:lysophospholipase L1-like esterase
MLFFLFVLTLSLFTSACGQDVRQEREEPLFRRNPNYRTQTELYGVYKTQRATIVMLGNSITQRVEWQELLGRPDVVNRGIGSDVTEGYLNRLTYVYALQPRIVCVMGGINDLYSNVPVETVFQNYKTLLEELGANKIIPVVQSTLFVSPKWRDHETKNREVALLNGLLKQYAAENRITYLDVNSILSRDGALLNEYTWDGVHLTASGYARWRDLLEPVLAELER